MSRHAFFGGNFGRIGTWQHRVVLAAIVLGLAGCPLPPDPPTDGYLDLAFELGPVADSPLAGIESLSITFSKMEVIHRSVVDDPSTERRIIIQDTRTSLNIVDVPSRVGEAFLVTRSLLPMGFLMQIRLVTDRDAPLVMSISGALATAKIPSGPQTGLKIIPRGVEPFQIHPQQVTTVKALFDPRENVVSNPGQGFLIKPTLPGVEVDPGSVVVIDPVTPGTDFIPSPGPIPEQRAISLQQFVDTRIAMIDRPEVETIVRGTVTALSAQPVVEPNGEYEIATAVTMSVEESFILDVGPDIVFLMNGGLLPDSFPEGAWPRGTSRSLDAKLAVAQRIQAVLYRTQRDFVSVRLLYGGEQGVTPLELPPGSPVEQQAAIDAVLAHTEEQHGTN